MDEILNYDYRKLIRGRRSFSGENILLDFELCKGGSKEIGGEVLLFYSLLNFDSKKYFILIVIF